MNLTTTTATTIGSSTGVHLHYSPAMGTYTSASSHRGSDILSLSENQIKKIKEDTKLEVLRDLFSGMSEGEIKMLVKMNGDVLMRSTDGVAEKMKIVATKTQLANVSEALEDRLVLDGNTLKVEELPIERGWYQDAKGELYEYLGEREWNLPNNKITREEATKMALSGELEFLN